MDKNKVIVAIVIVIVLGGIAAFVLGRRNGEVTITPQTEPEVSLTRSVVPIGTVVPEIGGGSAGSDVAYPDLVAAAGPGTLAKFRRFSLRTEGDRYIPSTVIVGKGDSVMLNIAAVDKDYAFTLPDYGINVEIKKGETRAIRFGVSAADQFMFYCESCGGPEKGPVGYLTVVGQNK